VRDGRGGGHIQPIVTVNTAVLLAPPRRSL
jgi:hypothetical protein